MISILTATYNRSHTLDRLFSSLLVQNDNNIEWIVVDDGSEDGTDKLIQSFTEKALFNVKYIIQDNSGKHVAINNGVSISNGDFVLIVDSDDALTRNAIYRVEKALKKVTEEVLGVCFRKSHFDGQLIGRSIESSRPLFLTPSVANSFFEGDLAYIFRKSSLLENPFPIFYGEKFVPELYVWNCIGDKGKILYYPRDPIYMCEYLPDGYTANFKRNMRENPKGFSLFYSDQFRREKTLVGRIKCVIRLAQCFYYAAVKRLGI